MSRETHLAHMLTIQTNLNRDLRERNLHRKCSLCIAFGSGLDPFSLCFISLKDLNLTRNGEN
jgi:hypothetical protein